MAKQNNIPQLRFPEFIGEWETKRFGTIVILKSEKYNPEKDTTSYKCIELEHLVAESGQLSGYIDSVNSGSIKNKFEKGDVLFGKLRPYLKKYLQASFEGVCSSEIWILKGINISNNFLYRLVQTDSFIELTNQSSGSKMPRADWSVVKNGFFSFPSLPEQSKIASFLTATDKKIAQLKQKKKLLDQYKKGVMQKLFSQELRFKDDNGKEFPVWKSKKFSECLLSISTRRYQIKSSDFQSSGKYKVIDQGKDLIAGYSDNDYSLFKNIPIIVFGDHTTVLKYIDFEFVVGADGTKLIKNKEGYDLRYLYYNLSFNNIQQEGYKRHFAILSKVILQIPPSSIQTKIAKFLFAIDEKINYTQTQIEKTELFKRGLLQRMFC